MVGRSLLNLFGMIACKIGVARDTLSLSASLKRCSRRGLQIGSVIDVGASDGRWSRVARKYFPQAACLLIEAQEEHRQALERMKAQVQRVDYVIAAAGDKPGNIYFDAEDLFGGLASLTPVGRHCRVVPMITVDDEVSDRGLSPPYLLKLDTHGFELPILEGSRNTLAAASLVVIEAYNFKLTADSLKFHEMCTYMEEKGFSCIDIIEPMHRPGDKVFWQMDLVFMPSDSAVFTSNSYFPQKESR